MDPGFGFTSFNDSLAQELRGLKEQARRAGKTAKASFKISQAEMLTRHEQEAKALESRIQSAAESAGNVTPQEDAAIQERVCKVCLIIN